MFGSFHVPERGTITAMSPFDASTGPINRKAAGQSPAETEGGTPRDARARTMDNSAGGPGQSNLVTRLRRWTHAVDAVPASDLLDEAADEIERLRLKLSRIAKCDNTPQANATPGEGTKHGGCTLTDAEREAVAYYIGTGGPDAVDATLAALLERTTA